MLRGVQVGSGHWGKKLCSAFSGKADIVGYYNNQGKSRIEGISRIEDRLNFLKILSSDIDFVSIATPLEYLEEYAILALAHNKHLFLEKPGASSSESLKKIKKISQKNKKKVFIGYRFVYDSNIIKLSNDFPELLNIEWKKFGSFGNDINVNLLCHHLSILKKIYGSLDEILITEKSENLVQGCINDRKVNFSIDRNSIKEKHHRVYCNLYNLEIGDGSLDNEIDSFIDCIENEKEPETNIDFAIHIMEALEKI